MNDFKKFGGGFRDKRGGGRFDRPGEGRRGGFGGGRPSFGGGQRFGGGRPSFGGRGGFGGGRDEEREMFDTTCSDCGKPCQVPFRPTGEKPVFCNDCFASKKGADGGERRFDRRDDRRDDRRESRDERPQAPRESKADGRIDALAADVQTLHAKLDSLIMMIETHTHHGHTAAAVDAVAPAPEKVAKTAKTKKVEAVIAARKVGKAKKK